MGIPPWLISISGQVLETIAYAISLAYAARSKFPFSTYGENFFLTIQNVVITLLIVWHSGVGAAGSRQLTAGGSVRASGNLSGVLVGAVIVVVTSVLLASESLVSPSLREWRSRAIYNTMLNCIFEVVSFLQASTVPLALVSKAPQILSNYQLKSTGNLSAFAVFNAFLGCLARLFTTSQETGDNLMWWGFALAGALNAVLVVQMIVYWNNSGADGKSSEKGIPMTFSPIRPSFDRKVD